MQLMTPRILPEASRAPLVRSGRRILCVFPPYAPSFGTFQYAYPLMPGVRAFMPPQGMLLIAAYLPRQWEVRFVDLNMRPVSDADFQWADVVFISGMHVQRASIDAINAAAHRFGKITVLGGPSVSGCPEYYPDVDVLHLGEIGDATDALIRMLDISVDRPGKQMVFKTSDRLPMERFPRPAYNLINMRRYFLGSIQFSSGCPFMCEFCDIPALYGRNPRLKTPEQIEAELDAMLAAGVRGAIYFVDDNFIANPAAARTLLPALIDWQQRRGYPIDFSCEATMNLAQFPDILDMMRRANFRTVFCGIETPEAGALVAMHKKQNMRQPLLDAIRTLNEHGLEVVSGIILGLDTDTPDTADHILEFIDASRIPMLTINLLYALPRTPLYDRLEKANRLIDDPDRPSNVEFLMPYQQVLAMWRKCIGGAYQPQRLFERFAWQCEHTYPNVLPIKRKVSPGLVAYGLGALGRIFWRIGVRGEHRKLFWEMARPLMRQGRFDDLVHIAVVTHHLLTFTRQCMNGQGEASFYADPSKSTFAALEPALVEA